VSTEDGNVVGPLMFVANARHDVDHSEKIRSGEEIILKKAQLTKLKAFASSKLKEVYPLIFSKSSGTEAEGETHDGHIIHVEVANAVIGGFSLSSNAAKFNSKLGATTDITVMTFLLAMTC